MNHQKKHFDQHRRLFKDTNPNAALISFGTLIVLLIVFYAGCAMLSGCQKEISSFTSQQKPVIESDHHLMPPEGWNKTKRPESKDLWEAARRGGNGKGKGSGKPPKDTTYQPPTDTTGSDEPDEPQPPTAYRNVLYLDFDGETISGTAWNVNGDFTVNYAGMTAEEISYTVSEIAARYEPLGFTVTTDRSVFFLAAATYRQQCIFTESWEWYGQAGGVAYLGSYKWQQPAPCFVFSSLLGYSGRNCRYAGLHELGHTLGLRHVPQRDASGNITSQYCWDCDNPLGGNYNSLNPQFSTWVQDTYNWVDQFAIIRQNL